MKIVPYLEIHGLFQVKKKSWDGDRRMLLCLNGCNIILGGQMEHPWLLTLSWSFKV